MGALTSQALLLAAVRGGEIVYREGAGGLVGRLLDQAATSAAVDRATYVENLMAAVRARVDPAAGGVGPGKLDAAVAALDAFLCAPGTLSLRLTPAEPQPLAALGAVAAVNPASLLRFGELVYRPPGAP